MLPRREMLDLIVVDGRARGVVARDLVSGALEVHVADAVVLATGGYANVYFLSTNAKASNATAIWRAHRRGAAFANPGFVQFHPTCLPAAGEHQAKLTLMSESLRNDGRLVGAAPGGRRPPARGHSRGGARLLPRAPLSALRQPRAARPRLARVQDACATRAAAWGRAARGVYLDLHRGARGGWAPDVLRERYGNLFELYEHITGDDPLRGAMRIAPGRALHHGRALGRLRPHEHDPGLFVIGEANFSTRAPTGSAPAPHAGSGRRLLHPALHAGRLPRRARLGRRRRGRPGGAGRAGRRAGARGDAARPRRAGAPPTDFHRALGRVLWEACGIERSREGLDARRSTRWRPCARRSGRT